jgi:dienelactone hydrolase/uncharacterized protein YneF (UPF0154 family)
MSTRTNLILIIAGILILIVIILGFFIGYFQKRTTELTKQEPIEAPKNTETSIQVEKVKFTTEDGVEIVGDFYEVPNSKYAGILIHMMPSDRKSFKNLAFKLKESGYSALAIDLRGHGESINSTKGLLDYRKFSDEEHQASIYDIKSASKFLESKGFPISNQFLIGASIGANLSLQFLSLNNEIKCAVLLSPGLNYRGIKLENYLKRDLGDKLMVVVTKEDFQSYPSSNKIKELAPSSTILEYPGNAHGTDIFDQFPELYDKIIFFLKEKLL